MKRKKLIFDAIKTSLSRSELRKIMAGSGPGNPGGGSGGGSGNCYLGCSCNLGCQSAPSGMQGYTGCSTTLRSDGCYICHYSGGLGSCTG